MALNWPTFFKRLGSAIVFAAVMMTGLLWQDWMFAALVLLIVLLCLREFFRLSAAISQAPRSRPLEGLTLLAGAGLLVLAALPLAGIAPVRPVWPVLLFLPVLLIMHGTLSARSHWQPALAMAAALLYIVLPGMLFLGLRQIHWMLPLVLVLMIWMNDTMAYLVGSFIGRTPFSKISPKKTWEGTGGGALFTVALAAVWGWYSHSFRIVDWMALAACAAVAGTAGDLLESKLKRMAGVKDSGAMMPGHGGALDRFDSLLVAIPFAYAYAYWFMQ